MVWPLARGSGYPRQRFPDEMAEQEQAMTAGIDAVDSITEPSGRSCSMTPVMHSARLPARLIWSWSAHAVTVSPHWSCSARSAPRWCRTTVVPVVVVPHETLRAWPRSGCSRPSPTTMRASMRRTAGTRRLVYLDARLDASTVDLASGADAVCVFVNDTVDGPGAGGVAFGRRPLRGAAVRRVQQRRSRRRGAPRCGRGARAGLLAQCRRRTHPGVDPGAESSDPPRLQPGP